MKSILTGIFILTISAGQLTAQTPDAKEMAAYKAILNGDLTTRLSGNTAFSIYLEGYRIFLYTALHAGDSSFEAYNARIDQLSSQVDKESPWFSFISAEFRLQQAFIELKAGNELSSAWKLRQAFRIAEEGLKENNPNPGLLKTTGVMKCLIGSIPDNMQWVPSLFGISGSVDEGISLLKTACEEASWLCGESGLLLALSHSYLLSENNLAVEYASASWDSPAKPLPAYLLMNIYQRGHRTDESMKLYEKLSAAQRTMLPQLFYLAGNGYLQEGRYPEAREAFEKFTETHISSDFLRDAWYKTGLAWWLEGNRENAEMAMRKATSTGENATEADRYADHHARLPLPDRTILRIRFLTDGGYFDKAEALIAEVPEDHFRTTAMKTEYVYRIARLAHLQSDSTRALEGYRRVITLQGSNSWYFAPNSCLMAGYLLSRSDPEAAKAYFKKVRDYKGYEYEKGIERKAQAALSRQEK